MIEENDTNNREEKIAELIVLFSSLPSCKREIVLEIARIMSKNKKK